MVRGFYTPLRTGACVAAAALVLACSSPRADVPYRPVATVDQVMDAIVIPSSQAIFDAVVYENGTLVQAPAVDDDWFRVRMHAMAVAEAGNLLLMPPRARDGGWARYARALTDAAVEVAAAAGDKDVERLLQAGSELYASCTACHREFLPPE